MRFLKEWGWVLWVVVMLLLIVGGVWFRMAAPCSAMGNLPIKDIPARCLDFVKQ